MTFAVRLLAPWRGFAAGHLRIASSEAAALKALAEHPHGAAELVELDALPGSRTFRDCWRASGRACAVDLPTARQVRLNQLRAIRDSKLAELDIEQLRGRNVAAEKQVLRDLPATLDARGDLDAISDPEALAAFVPPELATP